MAEHKRGLKGAVSMTGGADGGSPPGGARDNRKEAAYWVSHRQGPFMVHDNKADCEQRPTDKVGYLDNLEAAVEKGFQPCRTCLP